MQPKEPRLLYHDQEDDLRILAHRLNDTWEHEAVAQSDKRDSQSSVQDVAIIIGGGPSISSSCARLFAESGMRVAIAARNPDKPVLQNLEKTHGVRRYTCDANEPAAVERLFQNVVRDLGAPTLVVHNIDGRVPGIFDKGIAEADPGMVFDTLRNSAFSAFLVGQQAARLIGENKLNADGKKGTIIFTNASAALKGFPSSSAFAMACHAKSGLAQSMARELMPQGIHVASVPIDAAVGWTQEDGTRAHRRAGTTVDDNMADPDRIAETYLQLHRQHRSTWTFEVVLRPWVERW
jgi:NAD(P)-dependent dehydrogenase (short-subunit alcohol dehydrogenase family)